MAFLIIFFITIKSELFLFEKASAIVIPFAGTTSADSIVLNHSYNFASANPCSYSQLANSSNAVLWLRGGGKYFVFTESKNGIFDISMFEFEVA